MVLNNSLSQNVIESNIDPVALHSTFFLEEVSTIIKRFFNPIHAKALFENIEKRVIKRLNELMERTLMTDFQNFKSSRLISVPVGNNNPYFLSYLNRLIKNDFGLLFKQYPVLKRLICEEQAKIKNLLLSIISSYVNDQGLLELKLKKCLRNVSIIDIDFGIADMHNNKCTAIVTLSNDEKTIFKPTSALVSEAYCKLLDWDNQNSLQSGKYWTLNRGAYHWQEYVEYKECLTYNDIDNYYNKAGAILFVVYLLNGNDYHYENIIASEANPILIDHETIIQPSIKSKLKPLSLKKMQFDDSVLDSFLLPFEAEFYNYPKGICGFGWHKETFQYGCVKEVINHNTDNWKLTTRIKRNDFFRKNLPVLNDKRMYLKNYLPSFISGFQNSYKLYLKNKTFLLSSSSPLSYFSNIPIRFIWRPTNVYAEILTYMKSPKNLKCPKIYERKIREYLSRVFKKRKELEGFEYIQEAEISQMLRGNIPFFEVNTSSRNLYTEHGIIENFFELNCMENLERKLRKLSSKDLEFQKSVITNSILG